MMRVRGAIAAAAFLLLTLAGCTGGPRQHRSPAAPATLLVNGFVVDPASDGDALRQDVLLLGDRIAAVGRDLAAPASARRIDLAGGYIVPGLWDMHAHVAVEGPAGDALQDYVAHGVLGIRDMGGRADETLALRAAVRSGQVVGPTMVVAGPTLNGEQAAAHHRAVRTAAEARNAVRELARTGIDFIKLHRRVPREAFFAIRDQARREGLPVAGHVPLALDWIEGAENGMATIEHIQTLVENEIRSGVDPIRATNEASDRLVAGRAAEIFAAMARNGTYWTPTLIFYETSWAADPPERRALKQALYARLAPLVRQAAAAGVRILAGTDLFHARGEGVWDELDRLVRAGLTARQALAAATVHPYHLLGRGPGPIVPGGEASMIVTARNPAVDIAAVRDIRLVLLRGRLLPTVSR